jgi:hypothetical protein
LRILRPFHGDSTDPGWTAFRAELAVRRQELLEAAGENFASVASDDPWLELADNLSLAVCTGEAAFIGSSGWRAEVAPPAATDEGVALFVAPFPFAGATSFGLSCRTLAPGRFTSMSELGQALANCTFRRLRVRVRPLEGCESPEPSSVPGVPRVAT